MNNSITLYHNNAMQDPKNTSYPEESVITDKDTLAKAVKYDHVAALFKDKTDDAGKVITPHYRNLNTFCSENCVIIDIDNDHSDNPSDWVSLEQIRERLRDVEFYAVESRNCMKRKNNKEPRGKWHLYFRLKDSVKSVEKHKQLMRKIKAIIPEMDDKACDAARCFFGVPEPKVTVFEGTTTIDCAPEPESEIMSLALNKSTKAETTSTETIAIGSRNNTLSCRALKYLCEYNGNESEAYKRIIDDNQIRCEEPLPQSEIDGIMRSAVKKYHSSHKKTTSGAETWGKVDILADLTDVGQARTFAEMYKKKIAYSDVTGWLSYENGRWVDGKNTVRKASQELTDKQGERAREELRKTRSENKSPEEIEKKEAQLKEVKKRRSSSRVAATITEAQCHLAVDASLLDADGYLLNTPTGTVDLRTGQVRQHNPEDYITKITGISPSRVGEEEWVKFLTALTNNDPDLIKYLQLVSGMCAVGVILSECVIMAYGTGGNGKSTFFNVIAKVLGDYSGTLSSDIFTTRTRKNKSPELAELRGKRLVIAAELSEGERLDTAMLKTLTSTDAISAEKKYKDPMSFTPSHTTVLHTNHLPKVGSNDKGTWDRIAVVPFMATFRGRSGEKKNYADYLFQNCGGAILQWVIDGAKQYLDGGGVLTTPAAVEKATRDYRLNNDWVKNFIDDCCVVGDGEKVGSQNFYQRYRDYCNERGEYVRNIFDFKTEMGNVGYKTVRTNQGMLYRGIGLKTEENEQLPF